METSSISHLTKLLFSLAIVSLAASIAYLAYSLTLLSRQLPEAVNQVEVTAQKIDNMVKTIDAVNAQIPEVLTEVHELRLKIPSILTESEAVRGQVSLVLEESAAIRENIPVIIGEMAAYHELIPNVIEEVTVVRKVIPPTLDRIELLINQLEQISQSLGENTVQNLFTGIIKAPFDLVRNFGTDLFPEKEISASDKQLIIEKSLILLNNGTTGQTISVNSQTSNLEGKIELLAEEDIEGQACRILQVTISNSPMPEFTVCRNQDDEWFLIDQTK